MVLEKNVGSYFLSYSLYSLRLEFCELIIGAALSTINDIETKISLKIWTWWSFIKWKYIYANMRVGHLYNNRYAWISKFLIVSPGLPFKKNR